MPELDELKTGELLLVASLRLYALPFRNPRREHADWRDGFIAAGIDQIAVPAFGALFDVVSRVPLRPLEIGCLHCRALAADEARFLRLIALNQHGRLVEAASILLEWVPPAAARLAAMPALGLAFALERGRLGLPLHDVARDFPVRVPLPDRGLTLLQ